MDRKRKCILTQLKGLLDILDEGDGERTCGDGDADTFVRNSPVSQELYPTCPVLKQRFPPKNENYSFQSTLREQNCPLVPYHDITSRDDRTCSCVTLDNKNVQYRAPKLYALNERCVPHSNFFRATSPHRNTQCFQRLSPKYIVSPEEVHQYCSTKASARMDPYVNEQRRPRKAFKNRRSCGVPARYAQSKELRGGMMFLGCDCDKTNGLQDKCLRFCCIQNPKCKHRPAACYLSQFSGGKHLPNFDYRTNKSTYNNCDESARDTIRTKLFNLIDEIVSPTYHEVHRNPRTCYRHTYHRFHPYVHDNADYSDCIQENYRDISLPTDCSRLCRKIIPCELNDMPLTCYPNYCAVNTPVAYGSPHPNFHLRSWEYPAIYPTSHCDCYVD